jgi:trigger factor
MSYTVENTEKSLAVITVTVPADEFAQYVTKSYNKNKSKYNVPGFRKGKATQQMVEKQYGYGIFFEDAVDFAIDATYPEAAKDSKLDIVSRPEISIENINKGEDFVYKATVALRPELTLGEYKGVEVTKASTEVTDADIENELKKEQERNSRLISVERPVENGDNTVIDFDGSVDGVHFDGGKGEDYPLVIGSHSFIEGFEEQLIGHSIGEEFSINVTFPENYHSKDLAGKPAVFDIKIKEIKKKELPEINDEFASEISEFETLKEYKADLKTKLAVQKENAAKAQNENAVIEKVVENASVEIPGPMLNSQIDNMINDYARRMQAQGLPLDQYMEFTGMTMENLRDQMKPNAERSIKTRLTLETVAKTENIEAEEADMDKELQKIADQYKMELDKIKELFGEAERKQMAADIKVQKAVEFLVSNAKFV